ncbi:MAG: Bcr/CflA family multidrug efflux MFS transporter [Psychromonas sp.]|nr:Bcr/CflA family multidrug efflux MFS transporter [Psychromonas sp.]
MIKETKLSFSLIFTLAAIAALMPFAIDMYLPAMLEISHDLGVGSGAVQLTLTAFMAGFAIAQLFNGPIVDSFGRKPVLMFGMVIFIVLSILSSFVVGIKELTLARASQGVACASIVVAMQAVIRDMFDKEDFSRVLSFISLSMIIAPLIAPLLGGYLSVWFGWRSIFWVLSLIGMVTMLVAYIQIPETLKIEHRQLFNAHNSIRHYVRLFTNVKTMGLILTTSFNYACLFAFITGGSFVYINVFKIPVQHVGYLFGCNIIFIIIMSVINARFVRRQGLTWMVQFALAIHFIAGILLVVGQFLHLGLWAIVVCLMMLIGTLPVIACNVMALLLADYPHIAGTVVSLSGTCRFSAGAIAAAIMSNFAMTTVWPMVFTMTICSCASFFIYWLVVKRSLTPIVALEVQH